MPNKIATPTGHKNVIDRKVERGGAHKNALRRMQRQPDGTDKTTWQRQSENLTQWHPRWAKIDTAAGYTEFT